MAFTDYGGGASNGQSPAGSQSADFNGGASAGIVEQKKKPQPSATQQNPATAAPPSQTFAQMQAAGVARPTPDLVAKTTSALGNQGFAATPAVPQANAQTPAIVTQTTNALQDQGYGTNSPSASRSMDAPPDTRGTPVNPGVDVGQKFTPDEYTKALLQLRTIGEDVGANKAVTQQLQAAKNKLMSQGYVIDGMGNVFDPSDATHPGQQSATGFHTPIGNITDPEFVAKQRDIPSGRGATGLNAGDVVGQNANAAAGLQRNGGPIAGAIQYGTDEVTKPTGTLDVMRSPTDRVSMALGPNGHSNMVVDGESNTGVDDPNKPFNGGGGGGGGGGGTTTTTTGTGAGYDWTYPAPNHPAYNPPKIDPVTGLALDSYSSSDPSGMYSSAGNYTNAPSAVNDALQQFTLSNMQNPSRYSTDAFNSSLQSGLASLGRQFGAQTKQLDENMARRGISSSSFAGGYYGDLAGQQADSTNAMLSGLLTNQANNWAADQSAAAGSAQNLMNSQNQQSQFMNNLAQQLGIAQMGNATANRGITSQEGIANMNAKNAAAMQMQSLMQQLGIAKMGDYTANRGIDTNANAQQNEWLMRFWSLMQQYLPKAP